MLTRAQQDARHREVVAAYYATGDEALLSPMLAELRPRLLDFLKGKGLEPERRADLVQDALVNVLTALRAHKYTATGSVASWAMATCWHCFTTSLRRKTNAITQPGADEDPFLLLATALTTPAEELPISQEDEQHAHRPRVRAAALLPRLERNGRRHPARHCRNHLPGPPAPGPGRPAGLGPAPPAPGPRPRRVRRSAAREQRRFIPRAAVPG
jgi:DNA-directed RNA polymerase specialized sigma24 family protein